MQSAIASKGIFSVSVVAEESGSGTKPRTSRSTYRAGRLDHETRQAQSDEPRPPWAEPSERLIIMEPHFVAAVRLFLKNHGGHAIRLHLAQEAPSVVQPLAASGARWHKRRSRHPRLCRDGYWRPSFAFRQCGRCFFVFWGGNHVTNAINPLREAFLSGPGIQCVNPKRGRNGSSSPATG